MDLVGMFTPVKAKPGGAPPASPQLGVPAPAGGGSPKPKPGGTPPESPQLGVPAPAGGGDAEMQDAKAKELEQDKNKNQNNDNKII